MNSFYVVLASNTKKDSSFTESNRQGNFLTRLPDILDFSEGEWTVGLSSIIYPVSFIPEVMSTQSIIFKYFSKTEDPTQPKTESKKHIFTDMPLFDNVEALQAYINTSLGNVSTQKERDKRQIDPAPIGDEMDWTYRGGKKDKLKFPSPHPQPPPPPPSLPPPLSKLGVFIPDKKDIDEEIRDKKISDTLHLVDVVHRAEAFQLIKKCEDHLALIENDLDEIDSLKIEMSNMIIRKANKYEQVEKDYISQHLYKMTRDVREFKKKLPKPGKDVQYIKNRYLGPIKSAVQAHLGNKNLEESEKLLKEVKKYVENLNKIEKDLSLWSNKSGEWGQIMRGYMDLLDEWILLEPSDLDSVVLERIKKELAVQLLNPDFDVYFYFVKEVNKFFLFNNKPDKIVSIKLTPQISKTLGFEIDNDDTLKYIRLSKGGGFASYFPDIDPGVRQIYVYMPDLIEDSFVGDSKAPLLRVINVDRPIGSWAENIYTLEYHHKLIQKRINSIRITLYSGAGNEIQFASGNVIVILHFRKNFF